MESTLVVMRSERRLRRSFAEPSGSMKPARRGERHSIGAAVVPQTLELSLLEHIQVQFVKAYVPTSRLSRPRYLMKVTNLALNQSWEMLRPFKEFYDMKERVVKVLDHGHLCQSNCPWLYMFVTHHFPRRHFFRSRHQSVVSERLRELETFMNTLLKTMKEDRSLECSISAQSLPKIVYDFLFEGMVFDRSDFNNTVLESRVSLPGAPAELRGTMNEESCSICDRPLRPLESFVSSKSLTSDPTRASASSSLSSPSHDDSDDSSEVPPVVSITTLECGHRYHDECILEKLNKDLKCPLCETEAAA